MGPQDRGLFEASIARCPEDFAAAAQRAIARCLPLLALVEAFAAAPEAGGSSQAQEAAVAGARDVIYALDGLSNALCLVMDAAECCRRTHASEAWRDAANEAFFQLAGFMHQINVHKPLYDALVRLMSSPALWGGLDAEEQRMAASLRAEFERDGIHLDAAAKERLLRLRGQIDELSYAFTDPHSPLRTDLNAAAAAQGAKTKAETETETTVPTDAALPFLSHSLRNYAQSELVRRGPDGPRLHLPPASEDGAGIADSILRASTDPEARRVALLHSAARHAQNVPVLSALQSARRDLAAAVGFRSFAHLSMRDRCAGTPEQVVAFLQRLAHAALPAAAREAALVASYKTNERLSASEARSLSPREALEVVRRARLQPWDALHCQKRAEEAETKALYVQLQQTQEGASLVAATVAAAATGAPTGGRTGISGLLAPYSTLPAVVRGMQAIARRVFGVEMEQMPFVPSSDVTVAADGRRGGVSAGSFPWDGEHTWHRYDTDYARYMDQKQQGAGKKLFNFSLGGDRSKAEPVPPLPLPTSPSEILKFRLVDTRTGADRGFFYMDLFARHGKPSGAAQYAVRCGKRSSRFDQDVLGSDAARGQRQLPILVMCTSFTPSHQRASGLLRKDGAQPPSFSYAELETIFHEWGHTMHSLMSDTACQHLSGTRVFLDFSEVPSSLSEYWLRDFRVAREWAHADPALVQSLGLPPVVPEALFQAGRQQHQMWRGLDLQTSISQSLFDIGFHANPALMRDIAQGGLDFRTLFGGNGEGIDSILEKAEEAVGQADLPVPLAASSLEPSPDLLVSVESSQRDALTPQEQTRYAKLWDDPLRLSQAIHNGVSLLQQVPTSTWPAGFAHITNYAVGYYAYMYAATFSSALWAKLFAEDPWSRASGEKYVSALLSRGGTREPSAMLTEVLGGPPTLRPLLQELGVAPAPHTLQ
jgi:Zn-dependent oligopeptidase